MKLNDTEMRLIRAWRSAQDNSSSSESSDSCMLETVGELINHYIQKPNDQETNKDLHDFVLLALHTGVRQQNILSMRWELEAKS